MFLMGGAFVGLDEIRKRPSGGQVGFGGEDGVRGRERLRDCLVEYGLIPELVSRIGSVIVCNDPQLPDLVDICNAPGGLITCYRHLWRGMGMTVSVTADAVDTMAGYGIETGSFARGMQAVLNRLTERLVFEARKGRVRLGDGEVRSAVESMGGMG
jgi:ATP-dependent protease Clp ATPase subunit